MPDAVIPWPEVLLLVLVRDAVIRWPEVLVLVLVVLLIAQVCDPVIIRLISWAVVVVVVVVRLLQLLRLRLVARVLISPRMREAGFAPQQALASRRNPSFRNSSHDHNHHPAFFFCSF